MNQINREIELIKYVLDFHGLRLLAPIRLTDSGYEVMINLDEKAIAKKELKKMLEMCSLNVIEIDTLKDSLGLYGYAMIGKDSKFLKPIDAKQSDFSICQNFGEELLLCEPLMDTIFFDTKLSGGSEVYKLNFVDGKLNSIKYREKDSCFCPFCGERLHLRKANNTDEYAGFFSEASDPYIED